MELRFSLLGCLVSHHFSMLGFDTSGEDDCSLGSGEGRMHFCRLKERGGEWEGEGSGEGCCWREGENSKATLFANACWD